MNPLQTRDAKSENIDDRNRRTDHQVKNGEKVVLDCALLPSQIITGSIAVGVP